MPPMIPFANSVPPFQLLLECGCASKMDGCALNEMLTEAGLSGAVMERPIDAAAVPSLGPEMLVTVDGGSPIFPDPAIAGRAAFNHVASDIYARGGDVSYATVFLSSAADLPRPTLSAFLRGIREAADERGCAIVNGHTAVGDSAGLRYALTLLGRPIRGRTLSKRGAEVGNALFLSKAIVGSIVLKSLVFDSLSSDQVTAVARILSLSNFPAAVVALDVGATACTDVTGFGLVGSLAEMLPCAGARIHGDLLPLFPGTAAMFMACGASNSAAANRKYAAQRHQLEICTDFQAAVAADPVTAGPLLISAPRNTIPALESAGLVYIGDVVADRVLAID